MNDLVILTLKRETAELVRLMMPMPSILTLPALKAGLEFAEAVDKALGKDTHADESEEPEPEYVPPR